MKTFWTFGDVKQGLEKRKKKTIKCIVSVVGFSVLRQHFNDYKEQTETKSWKINLNTSLAI